MKFCIAILVVALSIAVLGQTKTRTKVKAPFPDVVEGKLELAFGQSVGGGLSSPSLWIESNGRQRAGGWDCRGGARCFEVVLTQKTSVPSDWRHKVDDRVHVTFIGTAFYIEPEALHVTHNTDGTVTGQVDFRAHDVGVDHKRQVTMLAPLVGRYSVRGKITIRLPDGYTGEITAGEIKYLGQSAPTASEPQPEHTNTTKVLIEQQEKAKQVAAVNKTQGEAFLAANKSKEGVVTLPDGLQYKILTAGTGPKPTASDSVACNYRGTLINGTEFDSSYKHGHPATFGVGQVIKGWAEALQLMPMGSKWQLFIPSSLAYGERGAGADIGPNATLIFEVELLPVAAMQTEAAAAASSAQAGAEASEPITLQAASDSGLVEYSFTGTGGSSGDAVRLKLRKTSKAHGPLTVSIPPGTMLRSSNPSAQSMVVSRVRGADMGGGLIRPTSRIVLGGNADAEVDLILLAFCAELEKNNPSSSTTFSLENPDPMLACITSEGKSLSVAAEQAAIWMYTNHATYEHVNRKFPVARTDWWAAEDVVEHCRMGEATNEHPNKSVKPEEKR